MTCCISVVRAAGVTGVNPTVCGTWNCKVVTIFGERTPLVGPKFALAKDVIPEDEPLRAPAVPPKPIEPVRLPPMPPPNVLDDPPKLDPDMPPKPCDPPPKLLPNAPPDDDPPLERPPILLVPPNEPLEAPPNVLPPDRPPIEPPLDPPNAEDELPLPLPDTLKIGVPKLSVGVVLLPWRTP
jgi:hypothetical protein